MGHVKEISFLRSIIFKNIIFNWINKWNMSLLFQSTRQVILAAFYKVAGCENSNTFYWLQT